MKRTKENQGEKRTKENENKKRAKENEGKERRRENGKAAANFGMHSQGELIKFHQIVRAKRPQSYANISNVK